jgi:hypothetical protein
MSEASIPLTGSSGQAPPSHPAQKRRRLATGFVATSVIPTQGVQDASPSSPISVAPPALHRNSPLDTSDVADVAIRSSNLTRQVEFAMSGGSASHLGSPSTATSAGVALHGIQHSYAELEATSHAFRLGQVKQNQKEKGTGNSYHRHVRNYTEFWGNFEVKMCRENPHRVSIPAFPITAAKAATFLQHESTREKVSFSLLSTIVLTPY